MSPTRGERQEDRHGSKGRVTRLRRFAVGALKSFQKRRQSIATMMRNLAFNTRLVFDYLRMTQNSITRSCTQ